jgi:hypothetical protein
MPPHKIDTKPLSADQKSIRKTTNVYRTFATAGVFVELIFLVIHVIVYAAVVLNAAASEADYLTAVLLAFHFVFIDSALIQVIQDLNHAYQAMTIKGFTISYAAFWPVTNAGMWCFVNVFIAVYAYKAKTSNSVKMFSYALLADSVIATLFFLLSYLQVRHVEKQPVAYLTGWENQKVMSDRQAWKRQDDDEEEEREYEEEEDNFGSKRNLSL